MARGLFAPSGQWSTGTPAPAKIQTPGQTSAWPKFAQNQQGFNITFFPKMCIIILENESFWAM